jgi:hypothetical protein
MECAKVILSTECTDSISLSATNPIISHAMSRVVFLGCFLVILHYSAAQENLLVLKDLRSEWVVYAGNSYKPYADREVTSPATVYFAVDAEVFKGYRLLIECNQAFSVFCEGVLVQDQEKKMNFSVDSLARLFNKNLFFIGVHQRGGIDNTSLQTIIGTNLPSKGISEPGPLARNENNLQNLTVSALLILIIFFSIMLRLNPRLTAHCFSVVKLFSIREGEESQSLNRIGNWGNILFYVFASLLTSFILLLFWNDQLLGSTQDSEFPIIFLRWAETGVVVLAAFFGKALILKMFSVIFNFREQMGFQFLNFMRLVSFSMILLILSVLSYRTLFPEGGLVIFYSLFPWILFGWLILVFIKLLNRVHVSVFHLFSYICLTELLPILFVVKALYE